MSFFLEVLSIYWRVWFTLNGSLYAMVAMLKQLDSEGLDDVNTKSLRESERLGKYRIRRSPGVNMHQ